MGSNAAAAQHHAHSTTLCHTPAQITCGPTRPPLTRQLACGMGATPSRVCIAGNCGTGTKLRKHGDLMLMRQGVHPELAVGRQGGERAILQRRPRARQQQRQEHCRVVQRHALRSCRRCMPHLQGPRWQGFRVCSGSEAAAAACPTCWGPDGRA